MRRSTFAVVAVAGAFVAGLAFAQEPIPRQPSRIEPTAVEKRMTALEQRVATLEQQNTELRKFVTITGDSMKIATREDLTIESSKQIKTRAGTSIDLDAATSLKLKSSGTTTVESSGAASLRASSITLNGGNNRLARTGSLVQVTSTPAGSPASGPILTGSATIFTD